MTIQHAYTLYADTGQVSGYAHYNINEMLEEAERSGAQVCTIESGERVLAVLVKDEYSSDAVWQVYRTANDD